MPKNVNWEKVADALESIGINEAKQCNEIREKCGPSDPVSNVLINRKLIGGNICCHLATAIRRGLK